MQVLSLFIQMNDTRLVYACILSLHMHLSVMHHSPRLVVGADYIGPDPSSMSIGSFISRLHFSCMLEKWVWLTTYSIFFRCARILAHCF